jgi:hypothetical protein
MRQCFALDHLTQSFYYLVAVGGMTLAACGVRTERLAPDALPPMTHAEVAAWVDSFTPTSPRRYDLRWTFQTQQGSVRGRASVRFAPPDSGRFDYRGPFGRSGAAVIVGDEIQWSRPEGEADQLIQVAPLFWAALGIPRYPSPEASVSGREADQQRAWRYAAAGDTLTYRAVWTDGTTLSAELRQAGDIVGFVEVEFPDSIMRPASAQMVFPPSASAVFFTVEAIDSLAGVDPQIWREP